MEAASVPSPAGLRRTRKRGDRIGDVLLYGLTAFASLVGLLIVAAIVWRVTDGAWPAIKVFKLGFLWHNEFNPVTSKFGARDLIIGTLVTSFGAMLLAAPLSIAIGLFLSELAPPAVRGPVGTLIEMLAAVPSVVIGLWGIFVLAPFDAQHVQPFLGAIFGWIPIFADGGDKVESTVFTAMIVLTIMIIPITASVARELFLSVPRDVEEAALAVGATRWEMIRGVVLPHTRAGLVAAVMLGLGRAVGEAIAVLQVIGGTLGIHLSLFKTGDTMASRIAAQYQAADTNIHIASLVYLALVLLVFSLLTNVAAQVIVRRFEFERIGGGN
jgi:phosphate transport system permease protein